MTQIPSKDPLSALNYDGRLFRLIRTQGKSDVSEDTVFHYFQRGDMLRGHYSGGEIEFGQLLGLVDEDGCLEFSYQHLTYEGEIMTGQCQSRPEIMASGKIRLYESWQWTSGDESRGTSIIEEF